MHSPTTLGLAAMLRAFHLYFAEQPQNDQLTSLYRTFFASVDPDLLSLSTEELPSSPEGTVLALAARYAASSRRPVIDGPAFYSIFEDLTLSENAPTPNQTYTDSTLSEGVAYPGGNSGNAHRALDRFIQASGTLRASDTTTLLSHLTVLAQHHFWCVPAQKTHPTSVSLYDYAKLSAALAAALGGVTEISDTLVEGTPALMLVVGDLGGIQQHIYRIKRAQPGTGPLAKRLRARSLEVSLWSEAMIDAILTELELPRTQRIMNAGGKFYLLLPNTTEANDVLEIKQAQWEEYSLTQGATLIPHLAKTIFAPEQMHTFQTVLADVHRDLFGAKQRPFSGRLVQPVLYSGASLRPCAAYDSVPARANEEGSVSLQAVRDEEVGRVLPTVTALSFVLAEDEAAYRFPDAMLNLGVEGRITLHNTLGASQITEHHRIGEVRPLLGHLPSLGDALTFLGLQTEQEYQEHVEKAGLLDDIHDLSFHRDRPLTFGEIASLATGDPLIGSLLLDADRMGELFARGFSEALGGGVDLARVTTLSRMLELFFASEVSTLIKSSGIYADRLGWTAEDRSKDLSYKLIYSVYSGGDDLFLIGPWDVLLEFALDLNKLYQAFTGGHPELTLSGGFVMSKPHLPIPQLATRLEDAEKVAKAAGRNHLTAFSHTMPWSYLPRVRELAMFLAQTLSDGDLPRGFAHTLLELHGLWQRWDINQDPEGLRYQPLLKYQFRQANIAMYEEQFETLFDYESDDMRFLPVWVQWALYYTRNARRV